MDLELSGKVALVTGVGSGIGAAIAKHLGMGGMRVAACDIQPDAAQRVAKELRQDGYDARPLAADVTDEASVNAMFGCLMDTYGAVHVVVNVANLARDIRVVGVPSRAAVPHMIEQSWGRIVNISSPADLGIPRGQDCSATLGGLIDFTRTLARAYGRFGITVNAVAPGTADPRIDDRSDVTDAVAFLASSRAACITGEVIHVTGGRH